VKDLFSKAPIEGARVYVKADAGGDLPEGTILFNNLTDSNGMVTDTKSFSVDQPISGHVRKASSPPYYKTYTFSGVIDSLAGLTMIAPMVKDE
jgi:hypothetical protein